jgi:hypothetical protein
MQDESTLTVEFETAINLDVVFYPLFTSFLTSHTYLQYCSNITPLRQTLPHLDRHHLTDYPSIIVTLLENGQVYLCPFHIYPFWISHIESRERAVAPEADLARSQP